MNPGPEIRTGGAASAPPASLLPWGRGVSWLFVAIVLISVLRSAPTLPERTFIAAVAVSLVFAASFLMTMVRTLTPAVLVCGLCGAALQLLMPGGPGFVMAIVALIRAGRLDPMAGRIAALAITAAYLGAYVATVRHAQPSTLLSQLAGLAFAYLAAGAFVRLAEEKRKTEELLQQVMAGRDAQIRAATLEERSRLAREIHDILAHTLSALSVQLTSARLLAEQRPGGPATLAAIDRASSLAREGLKEGRRAVGTLRGEPTPALEALPRLAADFERDSGVPCRFSVEGQPVELPPEEQLALYRTAQEALTNIRKHADASQVTIHLRYQPDGVELTVENDGAPKPSPLPGGGYGLAGLRERAELARGSLEAGATAAGFQVRLWLPA